MIRIIISVVVLLGLIGNSFAQQIDTSPVLTREDYMQISQNQRVGSVVLVLAGCTIGLVGSLIVEGVSAIGPTQPPFPIVPVALGVGCIAGGVALSRASKRNKQKALDASAHINLQSVSSYQFTALGKPRIPAFTIKLSLN